MIQVFKFSQSFEFDLLKKEITLKLMLISVSKLALTEI